MRILKINVNGVETYIYTNSIIKYEALEDDQTRIYCSPGTKDPYENDIYDLNIETELLLKIIHESDYTEGLDEILIDIEEENQKLKPVEEGLMKMRKYVDTSNVPIEDLDLSVGAFKV